MKKFCILLAVMFALVLSACGVVGPFTETMYEAAPTPDDAPEFGVEEYFTTEEMEQELQFAEYYHGCAGFELFLPSDWHYEVAEYDPETEEFGIDFWPSGSGDRRLRLRCYGGAFGVCGTGLVETEGELPGTGKLRIGYYDGRDYPSFISFYDSPGGWVLTNDLGSGWTAHEEEIEKILGSLVLDPGAMRVSVAEELAIEHCRWDYDYLRTEFDIYSGDIRVGFVKYGGELQASVCLEKSGDEYIVIADE